MSRTPILSGLTFFAALALLAFATPALAQSTAPQISSADPKSLYANSGSVVDITLYGTNVIVLGETALTFPSDVKLRARRNGRPFADASRDIKEWTSGRIGIEFDSGEFGLETPGTLDLMLVVKGVPSNVVSIPVAPYPSVPPTIVAIGPASFAIDMPTQHQYLLHIDAKNVPDDTKVAIDGQTLTFFADADFANGGIDVYVPEALRSRAGRYPVVLSSRAGSSNTVYLKIRASSAAVAVAKPHDVAPAATFAPPDTTRFVAIGTALSPDVRTHLAPLISIVSASFHGGFFDPVSTAASGIRSLQPSANPAQQSLLQGYVLVTAMQSGGVASVSDRRQKALQTLATILTKVDASQDATVSNLK